jgi:Type IV secretory system Conjugative DNA transfer
MIIKLAIALAVMLTVAAFAAWAFLPARHLPGNRARYLRIRLHLRLHPGKGFAHAVSLHLRWSRFAVLRRSGRIRPALPLGYRFLDPREHSVFLGRAHYRHGLRIPLEEHLLVMAPPRTFKTAFLADVILRYPGPVIATSTKPDVYALTSAVRARLGPVHVFNPQHIGGVGSTFCWSPVDGCEDPRPRSAGPTRSRSRSPRRASRTAPSGPPRPPTTCAATSVPAPWPATTCAPSPPGSPAPTRTSPSGS